MQKASPEGPANLFYREVYEAAAKIPAGSVATYGQLAAYAGNPYAARAAGTAMRNTPEYLKIPCHRVVNKSGAMSLAHVFGGAGVQRKMLESEGVVFKANGCVDMQRCLWNGMV